MVVSAAIGEFAEILADLEQTDKKVRSVALAETDGDTETVTARVQVGVPVIDGGRLSDDVTVQAAEENLTDGHVDVTLEFSIPAGSGDRTLETHQSGSLPRSVKSAEAFATPASTPPYKDPDVLETVYEQYDSFPKMTDALGVDVTSETVRRYMVKYGIHDPDESADESDDQTIDDTESESADDVTTNTDGPQSSTVGTETASSTEDESSSSSGDRDAESPADDASQSGFGERSVAEILADTDLDEEESLIADGVGVPRNLTVADLTEILNRSRTVSEVKRALDLDHDQTRRVLNELGVISFVTGRLTNSRCDISISEVEECIRNEAPSRA
ncbi:hypothetical protein [Natrinema halophilum]|uniref:hypothetical protein n=1 Tax=Natrinema halophilum TaxID=1699371 RepID=UPI001F48783E|nr:hypothetical protein [Natrinema halophilum]UHQ96157.1 hypothetical protein HYG82_22830 [Natrinema halophilum]